MPTVEQRALMSIASELKQIRKLMEDLSDNISKLTPAVSCMSSAYRQCQEHGKTQREDDIHE